MSVKTLGSKQVGYRATRLHHLGSWRAFIGSIHFPSAKETRNNNNNKNGQTAELQAFTTWVYGAAFHRINLPSICRRNKNKTTNNRARVYGALSQNYSTFHLPKKRETTTKQTSRGATSLHHLGLRRASTEVLYLPSPKETREKKQKQQQPNSTATSLHHLGLWPAFTELIHLPRAKEIANKQKPPKQTNKQTKTNKKQEEEEKRKG